MGRERHRRGNGRGQRERSVVAGPGERVDLERGNAAAGVASVIS